LEEQQFAEVLLARARDAGSGHDPLSYARPLSLDDLYLAQACVGHDERAWAECSRQHFDFLRDFARRFLSGSDAIDVTDQVIADLWERRKLDRYQGRSSLRTWLGAVVAHAALQARKTLRRQEGLFDGSASKVVRLAGYGTPPEDNQTARLLTGLAAEALEQLAPDDKLLLLLHYEQDLSLDQIGTIVGASKATLSRRLKRLRESVHATIERLARERYRSSAADVRSGVDLGRLELDLGTLLRTAGPVKENGGDGV
jgi:RNA polymerase sigma-70 factor (ECF subfamily)